MEEEVSVILLSKEKCDTVDDFVTQLRLALSQQPPNTTPILRIKQRSSFNGACQPGTSVHRVHVNCISHVTLHRVLTYLGCVYNRSM
jgi:hypothetical protein